MKYTTAELDAMPVGTCLTFSLIRLDGQRGGAGLLIKADEGWLYVRPHSFFRETPMKSGAHFVHHDFTHRADPAPLADAMREGQ